MRDVFLPIRQAYYTALTGSVTLNGANVPFYDVVPRDHMVPYIHVQQQNLTAISQKRGCETYEATILLEIVTMYAAYKGGRKDADLIADQIYQTLNAALPVQAGLQIGLTYVDSDFDQGREMTDTHTVNRRFIQFKNSVTIL